MPNPFYIGWQDRAPAEYRRFYRWVVGGIALLSLGISIALVLAQGKFASSTFELGQLTEIEGVLTLQPVPFLKVAVGPIEQATETQDLLLIGFGKFGAEASLEAMAKAQGTSLDQQRVRLRGSLIYHDGKGLLELSEGSEALVELLSPVPLPSQEGKSRRVSLQGEIVDPKCSFGVMKPGTGKPHRSCATRCLAGGIPPVFAVKQASGESEYFILLGEKGERINEDLLPYVGERLQICGQARQFDDWQILYLASGTSPIRLGSQQSADMSRCE